MIHRHLWQDYLDEVEHLRNTDLNKTLYSQRKETIERIFADAKEKLGMPLDDLEMSKKSFTAGDAYVCCHEP
jgi:hypothetical protein